MTATAVFVWTDGHYTFVHQLWVRNMGEWTQPSQVWIKTDTGWRQMWQKETVG